MIRKHFLPFSLHVLTGFTAVAAHYLVLFILLSLNCPALFSTTIGFGAGAMIRFLFSYFHIFSPTRSVRASGWRFMLALSLQICCNALGLKLGMLTGLSVWPAQILTTVSLTFINYAAYRWWVFR